VIFSASYKLAPRAPARLAHPLIRPWSQDICELRWRSDIRTLWPSQQGHGKWPLIRSLSSRSLLLWRGPSSQICWEYWYYGTKIKPELGNPRNFSCCNRDKVVFVARPLLSPVAQKPLYSGAEHVFILEHYYVASKSFAAVRKTFINAYTDKAV
jgi:hypothetical protein